EPRPRRAASGSPTPSSGPARRDGARHRPSALLPARAGWPDCRSVSRIARTRAILLTEGWHDLRSPSVQLRPAEERISTRTLDVMSDYRAPLQDIFFVLEHVVPLSDLNGLEAFAHADEELVRGLLSEAARFCEELVSPTNQEADRQGSVLVDGN